MAQISSSGSHAAPGGLWGLWLRNLLLTGLSGVYLELCLHLWIFRSADLRIVFPMLFALLGASLLSLMLSALPRIPARVLGMIWLFLWVFLAEIQLIYHAIFGNLMPLNLLQMGGGVVTNFGSQILYGISQNLLPAALLLLPLPAAILCMVRNLIWTGPVRRPQHLTGLGVLCVLALLLTGLLLPGRNQPLSVLETLRDPATATGASYRQAGMLATTVQELRYMLLGTDRTPDLDQAALGLTDRPRTWSEQDYNVLDLDFSALAASTEDETLRELDSYFSRVIPSEKNAYTGYLSGYNLITLCAESFSPWLISEELTPALYEMSRHGFVFENYYGTFQSVTTNGEYTMCMGLYPDMSRSKTDSSFDVAAGNHLPFCLGNALGDLGYVTYAYHNYLGDFYNRNVTHPNMGYTFKASGSGLDIPLDWPSSDLLMMEASVDDYLTADVPFHAYYMTFSGHYQYNWHNAMSAKNRDAVAELPVSEPVQAYIACNLELEYALEYLLERLEAAGIAEKTCIVLTNDHYPYGLSQAEYDELAGQPVDPVFEKYRNSFICYVPGMETDVHVTEYCSTADILPTLLNLFGVPYDSRLLAGTDVFGSGIHMAVLENGSFLTGAFRYDGDTGTVIPAEGRPAPEADTLEQYRSLVASRFTLSRQILDSDYYAHISGLTHRGTQDAAMFRDDVSIFHQSSMTYLYRNGFMEADSQEYFGGERLVELEEFVDVMYRIAGQPGAAGPLPEGFADGKYGDALRWALETGILRTDDAWATPRRNLCLHDVARLIYRCAGVLGVDTEVDQADLQAAETARPALDRELLTALQWCFREQIMNGSTGQLEELWDSAERMITRAETATFLYRLYTYELVQ